jgi:hypothetical protein
MIYFCAQRNRRAGVLANPAVNGIDFVEVSADQMTLLITFLRASGLSGLSPGQFVISGGEAVWNVQVLAVQPGDAPNQLRCRVDKDGDFSTYTLSLRDTADGIDPPDGFDPILSVVDFSFKAGCPSTTDCLVEACCPTEEVASPPINYLAKDYPGFVQAMLDRMAVLAPGWTERHAADLGETFVEVLAYVADHLSYHQDAIATEAYLGTARSRISLRRHARLVDYQVTDGANACAFVHVRVDADNVFIPAGSRILPRVAGIPARIDPDSGAAQQMIAASAAVFTTMADATLQTEQNELPFYTWGDTSCCLPKGATSATLAGAFASLAPGIVLAFEEIVGPDTGEAQDADRTKRSVVRLTEVRLSDDSGRTLVDPLTGQVVTEIAWQTADALPFSLCLSSVTDLAHKSKPVSGVSVARGNILPADHGDLHTGEVHGPVPPASPAPIGTAAGSCCGDPVLASPTPFFYPALAFGPLTFSRPYDATQPASAFGLPPGANDPPPQAQIWVQDESGDAWFAEPDLLALDATQAGFVPEIERDGTVFLRFGDDVNGMAPETGQSFTAAYRTGNGTPGNVGADILGHVIPTTLRDAQGHAQSTGIGVIALRNPLPAVGGVDPDSMERIRQVAPWDFRTQLRAVTEDDYGAAAMRDPAIGGARGTLRWTGSWRTAFVTIEPASGTEPAPAALATATQARLELLRMAGVDLDVEPAVIVGLRLVLNVCAIDGYARADIRRALMDRFTTGLQCNGQPGLLNPSRFTFGQTIYLSPMIAAAQSVDGVAAAHVAAFQRVDDPLRDATQAGFITLHRLEIARVDNDPSRPDRGIFTLELDGGR